VSSRKPTKSDWSILLDGIRNGSSIQAIHFLDISQEQVLASVETTKSIEFDPKRKTFTSCTIVGKIKLIQKPIKPTESEKTTAWAGLIASQGESVLHWSAEALDIKTRWQFAASYDKNWPQWPTATNWSNRCREFMAGVSSFHQLPLMAILEHTLGLNQLNLLSKQYPKTWQTPTGRNVKIEYDHINLKVTAQIKLQEAFGLTHSPTIGNTLPIELALLAPNGRPVAIVTDLPHFWSNVYPEVRKELRGRYAKHPWPEDPLTFEATRKTNRQIKNA
jgi:ATP-dependent helicase HrpB